MYKLLNKKTTDVTDTFRFLFLGFAGIVLLVRYDAMEVCRETKRLFFLEVLRYD